MNVKDVKTAFKVADVALNDHPKNHIKFVYLSGIKDEKGRKLGSDILKSENGLVYLLVENGIIKKIGGSQSKGGIKATLSFYQSAMQGGPSLRSFGIHILMEEALKKNHKIEVYVIMADEVKAPIKGLFSENAGTEEVTAYKKLVDKCKADYKNKEGSLPEWNFQERGAEWPAEIHKRYTEFLSKRAAGK